MRNTGDVFERTHQEDREVMSLEMSFVRGIPHTETSLWLTSIFCIKILSFNHKHSQNDFNTLKETLEKENLIKFILFFFFLSNTMPNDNHFPLQYFFLDK